MKHILVPGLQPRGQDPRHEGPRQEEGDLDLPLGRPRRPLRQADRGRLQGDPRDDGLAEKDPQEGQRGRDGGGEDKVTGRAAGAGHKRAGTYTAEPAYVVTPSGLRRANCHYNRGVAISEVHKCSEEDQK